MSGTTDMLYCVALWKINYTNEENNRYALQLDLSFELIQNKHLDLMIESYVDIIENRSFMLQSYLVIKMH